LVLRIILLSALLRSSKTLEVCVTPHPVSGGSSYTAFALLQGQSPAEPRLSQSSLPLPPIPDLKNHYRTGGPELPCASEAKP
uniref:Uncharacterized protein n=1 Tax=Cyanoderma ruficeps TaxID=181631 RepID=A0A8C3NUS4_9PASS